MVAVPVGFEAGLAPAGKFVVGSFALDIVALNVLVLLLPPQAYATIDTTSRTNRLMLAPLVSPSSRHMSPGGAASRFARFALAISCHARVYFSTEALGMGVDRHAAAPHEPAQRHAGRVREID